VYVTGRIPGLRFDWQRYMADLDAALRLQLRLAARAWLRAVIAIVPSWTGQSRGSLQPIGRFLATAVPAPVSATAPGDRTALGAAQQAFQFTQAGGVYLMHWETHVPHYLINEYYQVSLPLIHPTPWLSLEAGEGAWHAYLQANLLRSIPDPARYFHP
jgi:hypothetical protein